MGNYTPVTLRFSAVRRMTLTLAAAPAALGGILAVNVSTNGACDRLHVCGATSIFRRCR